MSSDPIKDLPEHLPLILLPSMEGNITLHHLNKGWLCDDQVQLISHTAERIATYRAYGHWTLPDDPSRTKVGQAIPLLKLLAQWWAPRFEQLLDYGLLLIKPIGAHAQYLTGLQNLHDQYVKTRNRRRTEHLFNLPGMDWDAQIKLHGAHLTYMAAKWPTLYHFNCPAPVKLPDLLPGLTKDHYAPFMPKAAKPVDFEWLLRKIRKTETT